MGPLACVLLRDRALQVDVTHSLRFHRIIQRCPSLVKDAVNSALYNESVPMEFTKALLVQARAHDRDVQAILRAARFPFDPLQQDAQTAFVRAFTADLGSRCFRCFLSLSLVVGAHVLAPASSLLRGRARDCLGYSLELLRCFALELLR